MIRPKTTPQTLAQPTTAILLTITTTTWPTIQDTIIQMATMRAQTEIEAQIPQIITETPPTDPTNPTPAGIIKIEATIHHPTAATTTEDHQIN
jgi:hypothetical protein